jgi:hypothetical protein
VLCCAVLYCVHSGASTTRRGRKTEKEEDERMLKDTLQEEEEQGPAFTRLTSSPACMSSDSYKHVVLHHLLHSQSRATEREREREKSHASMQLLQLSMAQCETIKSKA